MIRNTAVNVDPQSLQAGANALNGIVQLFAIFRQENRARKDLTHRDFIEWLDNHRHKEIKELITQTYHLQSEVDALLRQDHAEMSSKLDTANTMLVDILARIGGFEKIASAIVPDLGFSEQAIGLLRLLTNSKTGELYVPGEGTQILVEGYSYSPAEPRFLHDDIASLVSHGFLSVARLRSGEAYYRLTRGGQKFFNLLPAELGEDSVVFTKSTKTYGADDYLAAEDIEETYDSL